VLPTVWYLSDYGVDEVEGIQDHLGLAGARVGRRAEMDAIFRIDLHLGEAERGAGEVAGEAFEAGLAGRERLSGMHRETGPSPGEKREEELLREPFGLVEADEQEAPEEFLDEARVGKGDRREPPLRPPRPLAHQGMDVRMEVGEGAEGLHRGDHAGEGSWISGLRGEAAADRLVGASVWTARQLIQAFPWDTAPKFLLRDRDGIYGREVQRAAYNLGCEQIRTSPRSPWQNPYVERVIGSIRRECLDHVIIFNENHLRRVLRGYIDYYHEARTHLGLDKDGTIPRFVEPPGMGKVVAIPQVGGLHHRYTRVAA